MSRDIFDDRHRFTDARRAFVTKQKPTTTPGHLATHRTTPRHTDTTTSLGS